MGHILVEPKFSCELMTVAREWPDNFRAVCAVLGGRSFVLPLMPVWPNSNRAFGGAMSETPERFHSRVYVMDRKGEVCLRISAVEAAAWCSGDDPQATRLSRERIKLTGYMRFHPCRTRTGRSYTYQEPTHAAVNQVRYGPIPVQPSGRTVLAHKTIASEDRCYFRAAVLDNFVDLTLTK